MKLRKNQKYIGEERIQSAEEVDGRVKVKLQGGKEIVLKKEMFEAVATKNKTDATTLRDLRVEPIVREILKILLDWDAKLSEIKYILSKVELSLDDSLKRAQEKFWGKPMIEVEMSLLDKILKDESIGSGGR